MDHLLDQQVEKVLWLENHAEDIKLSTIEKFVSAIGKKLKLEVI
jgi:hypothetical protein